MAQNNTLENQLNEVLTGFINEETQTLFEGIQQGAKQCKKDVMQLSPKGKKYKQGWTVRTKKTKQSIEVIVYNKAQPALTWLLENGHAIRNKYGAQTRRDGGGARTTANPHISIARERAAEYISEVLQKTL